MSRQVENASELFADSEYLCKEMLWDSAVWMVIDRVEGDHKIPKPNSSQTDSRPVIFFEGERRGMVLNQGNKKFLIRQLGTVCAKWRGVEVLIYVDQTAKFGAETVGGLRLAMNGQYSGKVAPPRVDKPKAAAPKSPAVARFGSKLEWSGRDQWKGRPLTEASGAELAVYLETVIRACNAAAGSVAAKLQNHGDLVQAVIDARSDAGE